MLRPATNLENLRIRASDGHIGQVHDWLFDERNWLVRYLVADTATWLPGRRVLIPTSSVGKVDQQSEDMPVEMTQQEIKESPSIAEDEPVSLKLEKRLNEHYGWPAFGGGGSVAQPAEDQNQEPGTTLRSVREVRGYELHGIDGDLGIVHDFLIDDDTWTIEQIVVDTRKWLPGKKVLAAPQLVEGMSWKGKTVHLDLFRENIVKRPDYDPARPVKPGL